MKFNPQNGNVSLVRSKRKTKLDLKRFINNIIPFITLIVFGFLPTSSNQVIFDINFMILIWLFTAVLVLILMMMNKIDSKSIIISVILIAYMTVLTIIRINTDSGARISLARIAPIICLMSLSSVKILPRASFKLMQTLLDLFCLIAIVWNIGILLNIQVIKEFTRSFFSQYYDLALYYSMLNSKPVMSFGVHTYASYYYLLIFFLCYITIKKTGKNRFYIYCVCLTIFTLFLTSNTSIIFGIAMTMMCVKLLHKKPGFVVLSVIIGIIIIASSYELLTTRYLSIFHSGANGFLSRYSENNIVFNENFGVILNSLGIGFCIIDYLNLGYSDSGYVVYLTMGNVIFMIGIYLLLYRFLKSNIPKKYFRFICIVIFTFEIALPATFNYRFPSAIIFIIYYLVAIENLEKEGEN